MTFIQYQIEFYIRKNVYKVKKCMAVLAEGRRRTLKNWWEKCYQNQNKNVLNAEFYFVSDSDSSVNRENLPGKKRSTDYLIR